MAQIGTIGLQTQNNGVVKVPVFATGDDGSSVYDMLRVQTQNGGVGFIPLVAPADASFPYLRVQTQNNGVLAAHDSASLITWLDRFEDGDLTEYGGDGNLGITTLSYNGSYAAVTNNNNGVDSDKNHTYSTPYTIEFWFLMNNTGPDTGNHAGILFAAANESGTSGIDGYWLDPYDFNSNYVIGEAVNGTMESSINYHTTGLTTGTWYRCEAGVNSSGDIFADTYDGSGNLLESESLTPSNNLSQGIGAWSGYEIRIDDFKLLKG